MFEKTMKAVAKAMGCAVTCDGNVAYLIETGRNQRPSEKVWRTKFVFHSEDRISIFVRGKALRSANTGNTVSLAKLAVLAKGVG